MTRKMTLNQFYKKYARKYIREASPYDIMKLPKHQMKWITSLNKKGVTRYLRLGPRGHGKTTIFDFVFPAWLIANNPKLRILIVSNSVDMAESFSRTIRAMFEDEDFQKDFRFERGTPWKANEWTLKVDGIQSTKPTLKVVGAMGKMTGWRGDIIIFDDVLETKVANSLKTRKKLEHWIYSEVLPALDATKHQKVIVIGTPKHMSDWYSELRLNPLYDVQIDKAIQEDGSCLWPQVYDIEELDKRRQELGTLRFNQEYLCEPFPPEGGDLKTEWLKRFEHLPSGNLDYYIGVDPAHGSKSKVAASYAIVVLAHHKQTNKTYVIEMFAKKMSPESQVRKTIEVAERYDYKKINIEGVLAYTYVFEQVVKLLPFVKKINYRDRRLQSSSATGKNERVNNIIAPIVERGELLFYAKGLDPSTDDFVDKEYAPFPNGEKDRLDALVLALDAIRFKRRWTGRGLWS